MGIRVNAIAPGAIRTHALATVLTPEIEQADAASTRRSGAWASREDIANVALFLVAPASSWVSGQVLTVSGGGDPGARVAQRSRCWSSVRDARFGQNLSTIMVAKT